jgi:hypothetical protein
MPRQPWSTVMIGWISTDLKDQPVLPHPARRVAFGAAVSIDCGDGLHLTPHDGECDCTMFAPAKSIIAKQRAAVFILFLPSRTL